MSQLGNLLDSVATGKIELIDLTTSLSAQTPALRLPEPFVNLIDFSLEQVSAYNTPGPLWKHHNIHTGEHIGTHLDAPIHWFTGKNGRDVSQIPPERLLGPAVVLDFSSESAQNHDFLLEIDHVTAWEEAHGPIPQNAWLLLRTGWDRFVQDQEQFLNTDENGPHTPGFSAECAQWLAAHTPISGVGVETVGIDAGSAGGMEPPFPAHHYLLGHDKYGITSLQNLDKLPPTGAVIVVAPLPIVGGTGSPSRVFALVAQND